MAIDVATVKKVASLSRLREDEARLQSLAGELNGILGWIEQLNEVDVTGVEPMTTAIEMPQPMREDVVTDGDKVDAVMANTVVSVSGGIVNYTAIHQVKNEAGIFIANTSSTDGRAQSIDHFYVVPKVVE